MNPDIFVPGGLACYNKVLGVNIEGQHIDIICHKFNNKICIFITQYERINNIFVVRPNWQERDVGTVCNDYKEIVHLFGADTDETRSAIRHLVQCVHWLNECSVDIVINLGLKHLNRAVLVHLVTVLNGLWT